jgi:hypothetical protein
LARNTQRSYRDTLRLLLPFIAEQAHRKIDQLAVGDLRPEHIRQFLLDLEEQRHCSQKPTAVGNSFVGPVYWPA